MVNHQHVMVAEVIGTSLINVHTNGRKPIILLKKVIFLRLMKILYCLQGMAKVIYVCCVLSHKIAWC